MKNNLQTQSAYIMFSFLGKYIQFTCYQTVVCLLTNHFLTTAHRVSLQLVLMTKSFGKFTSRLIEYIV